MSFEAMPFGSSLPVLAGLAAIGVVLSFILTKALRPALVRYTLARPTGRGLHSSPTPQGGGIAVLCACALVALAGAAWIGLGTGDMTRLITVLAASGVLAVLGLLDDVRPLPPLPRLAVQIAVMTAGVLALPEGTRVLPWLSLAVERVVLVVGGAWFINLTNFMDGMDWMTVVAIVPLSALLVCAAGVGSLPVMPGLLALGLLAGLLGFAPENRPEARLFLGDVGSLPIGFLTAVELYSLAGASGTGRGLAAAAIVPLYSIADSGITLLWRLGRGHRIWEPHRCHFYQVAIAGGLTVRGVIARIGVLNLALAVLSWVTLGAEAGAQLACLVLALGLVTLTLTGLSWGTARTGV